MVKQLGHLDAEALSEKCDRVYAIMDANASGGIDFAEFQKGMLDCWGVQFSTKIIFNLFSKYDTDGSGMISADEFLELCKELLQLSREHKLSGTGGGEADAADPDAPASVAPKLKDIAAGSTSMLMHQSRSVMVTQQAMLSAEAEGGGAVARVRHMLLVLVNPSTKAGAVFSRVILVCILVSTVALAIDNQFIGNGSPISIFLQVVEYTVNVAFTLEFVMKFVALGWRDYFASIWNKINFFIVVTSDLDMLLSAVLGGSGAQAAGVLGIFRIFRVLRPLRIAAEQVPHA